MYGKKPYKGFTGRQVRAVLLDAVAHASHRSFSILKTVVGCPNLETTALMSCMPYCSRCVLGIIAVSNLY